MSEQTIMDINAEKEADTKAAYAAIIPTEPASRTQEGGEHGGARTILQFLQVAGSPSGGDQGLQKILRDNWTATLALGTLLRPRATMGLRRRCAAAPKVRFRVR
eukprot:TRINITY_DN590_c0_g2_i1.p1 TRINITY_DN590_c0_g2~~TRINITY_DN590_c0_g2_i1.p1  ORF type:complete len:120 (+),score=13.35 TRINITY_DN590_c0_g2_i1:51-362(+)